MQPITETAGYAILMGAIRFYNRKVHGLMDGEEDKVIVDPKQITIAFVDGIIREFPGEMKTFRLKKATKVIVLGCYLIHHKIVGCRRAWEPITAVWDGPQTVDISIRDEERVMKIVDAGKSWNEHKLQVSGESRKRMVIGAAMPGEV